jgi:hypothetical protein
MHYLKLEGNTEEICNDYLIFQNKNAGTSPAFYFQVSSIFISKWQLYLPVVWHHRKDG